MSYHVFFSFSTGLTKPIIAPKGTLARILAHVESVERTLKLEREQYNDNPVHWNTRGFPSADIDDKLLCRTVDDHNDWVRTLYDRVAAWAETPAEDGETITPEDAKGFWHGLQTLTVPTSRWSGDYYRARMETFYEVMRGRPTEGITFPAAKLTPKQAGAVVWLFEFLDPSEMRLEVPKGYDHLASFDNGEYEWCERCGAVMLSDAENCRKRGCPVQEGWCDEDRPEWFREAKKSA